MTNYLAGTHVATGAGAGRMDAGAGNTFGQFSIRVVSNATNSVVALETSPDNSTFTEVARVTGDGWATARSDHRQRYARPNIISLGTGGAPIASNVCSLP
jgi:hypothetical protein